MWTDSLGSPVTVEGEASLACVNDFVEGLIASEARAASVLQAAGQDMSPIVQGYAAAVMMFGESGDSPRQARPFLERALAAASTCTPREARFIHAIEAWVDGDIQRAIRLHEEQASEHPRDLASLKLGQYHLFNRGDSPGMLRIALAAANAAADVPYFHGMLAFAWEQCHWLEEAEAAARTAIRMRRKEPWAHHALAHVMLTQGRIREGHEFLQDVGETWTGLNSFMVTHNWWHQALFALELDRTEEALSLYDLHVWGVARDYSQDQVNAVSLLARLELAGADAGERWQDVGRYLRSRTADHVLPFLDMQYLYGLARAGLAEADMLLTNIEAHAGRAPADTREVWRRVAVPASRGLVAHARGDYARAVDELGQALPRMTEIGGSHAQRDLFSQVHLDALIRSGHLAGAQNVLAQQVRLQPESLRLRRQVGSVYRALGLPSLCSGSKGSVHPEPVEGRA